MGASSFGHENHDKISKTGQICGWVGPGCVLHNEDKVIDRVGDVEILFPDGRKNGRTPPIYF